MRGFFALVSIENRKMWKRLATKVMFLIVIALVILTVCVSRYKDYMSNMDIHAEPTVSADWQASLQSDIESYQAEIASIKAGTNNYSQRSYLGALEKDVAEDQYRLANNIAVETPFSTWSRLISQYDNAGFGFLIGLMMIIACAAAVAGEYSEGTVKMMFSRPFYRDEILSAKFIAVLGYGLLLFLSTFAVQLLMDGLLYGIYGMGAYAMFWANGAVYYIPAFLKALAFYGLDFVHMLFYATLTFALAVVFRSRSIATGFALFMLLLGEQLAQLVCIFFSWAKYFPFSMMNLRGFVTNGSVIEGTKLSDGILFTAIYILLFAAVSYITFAKRDV